MKYTAWYNDFGFLEYKDLEIAKRVVYWALFNNGFEFYESAWIREFNDKGICVAEYYWSQLPETLGWNKIEKTK